MNIKKQYIQPACTTMHVQTIATICQGTGGGSVNPDGDWDDSHQAPKRYYF